MPTFEHDGVILAYDDTGGERGAPPIVLLHGLSTSRATWGRLPAALRGSHRVVTVDHRGHGESAHAPGTYTLDHYGPDAVAFCEQVVGQSAVLVGHSLGGVVAVYVARERPDLARGIVLEDPPLYRGDPSEAPAQNGVAAFFQMMQQMLRGLRDQGAPIEQYEAVLQAAPALNGSGGTMADVLGTDGTRTLAQAWADLDPETFTTAIDGTALVGAVPAGPLACPVLLLRADPALGAAFTEADEAPFLATNPKARVMVIEGASHAIHDEQPDRFLAEVRTFLDDL